MKKRNSIKRLLVLLSIGVIITMMSPLISHAITIKVGEVAPDFKLEDLFSGKKITLSEHKGKPVLLTFWATWCPRCWEELDYVKARFSEEEGVVVLLVNMETQNTSAVHVKRIQKKSKEHQVKFPLLLDKELEVWKNYGVNSLPSTVIVDPDGKVVFAEPNFYFASRDNIEEILKKYLTK
ncbi:peroxiredoxin family protein [Thermodesulfobacteriota bacterium]